MLFYRSKSCVCEIFINILLPIFILVIIYILYWISFLPCVVNTDINFTSKLKSLPNPDRISNKFLSEGKMIECWDGSGLAAVKYDRVLKSIYFFLFLSSCLPSGEHDILHILRTAKPNLPTFWNWTKVDY